MEDRMPAPKIEESTFKNILQIMQLGNPVLNQVAEPVNPRDALLVEVLVNAMIATLLYTPGAVGLSAPQVGAPFRIFVMADRVTMFDPQANASDPVVYLNPRIVESSEETEEDWESCLSFPGFFGKVNRSEWVKLEFFTPLNLGLGVPPQTRTFYGYHARVAQHEMDHLDGKIFLEKLTSVKDLYSQLEWRKIKEAALERIKYEELKRA